MIDRDTSLVIQDVLRRESRSLLQYASESLPRFTASEAAEVVRLQHLAEQELTAARSLAAWLRRNHVQPPLSAPWPASFMDINFAALPFVLGLIQKDHREAAERLQNALHKLVDPEAKKHVQALLEQKERTLAALKGWNSQSSVLADAGH